MDSFALVIFLLHSFFWGGALILLVYFIVRRIKIKEKEDFEDRDN